MHIARISKRLLKEKFSNKIKIIDDLHERELYNILFFSGIIDNELYNKLKELWKTRNKYAHNLDSVDIPKSKSKQLVKESLKIIEKLDKKNLKEFIDRLSS